MPSLEPPRLQTGQYRLLTEVLYLSSGLLQDLPLNMQQLTEPKPLDL